MLTKPKNGAEQRMEKWSRKNASGIRQVSRTECFTNRKEEKEQ
jgi:hypothetical protein